MKLSLNAKSSLYASFYASSKVASWSTFPSMSYEAALKSAKKIHQKSKF
jgi:hypothetical protein